MPKYATLVIDSATELARLAFARDMKKVAGNMEVIPDIRNWPGSTERVNILFRRLKDLRDLGGAYKGLHVYITANEQIDRDYPKGSAIEKGAAAPPEPYSIKGVPDLPGRQMPESVGRSCDNILRMRYYNGKAALIARRESIGAGNAYWEVKDRMGLCFLGNGSGIIQPPSWAEIQRLTKDMASYITLVYGPYGIGKTSLIETFPKPIKVLDIDRGTKILEVRNKGVMPEGIDIVQFNSENGEDYLRLLMELEACFK